MTVSVIIPVYNEEKVIDDCLRSLSKQSWKDLEVIVVDDGSSDQTGRILEEISLSSFNLKVFQQNHLGPALARNLGAEKAHGEILVFVDADMTFDEKFVELLTKPIRDGKTMGTFSKEEFVLNKDNIWGRCWNINKGLPQDRMHPPNYPDVQPVFRAILKKEFQRVGGFDPIGYVDDYTLSKRLGKMAEVAPGAVFFHRNPETLGEIFRQARWIGKSEFKLRKVKNEFLMKIAAIIRYSPISSVINSLIVFLRYGIINFLIFKIVYDCAVEISLIESFWKKENSR